MKENSIFTTGLFVVALLLLFLSVGRLLGDNDPERFKVSVVVDHSNSDVWSSFKMGLTAAGRAYNMEYNFVSTDRLVSIQQENISMQREIQSGADGIIAELRATEGTGLLLNALGKNAEIMLVDSQKETTEPGLNISSVNVEEEALGKALAEQVLHSTLHREKKRIGILAGNQNKGNMQRRLHSLLSVLEAGGQEIAWVLPDRGKIQEDMVKANHKRSVDLIVALENDSLEMASRYLKETGRRYVELYGVGNSREVVYALDTGVIRCLAVIDQYTMAYYAMEDLWYKLSKKRNTIEDRVVNFYMVTGENMYSEEIERILFPTGD